MSRFTLPLTPQTLVLRTDFRDDAAWQRVCEKICSSSCEGFVESYTCVSDSEWADFPLEHVTHFDPPPYFYLVVDRLTIDHDEHPVLAVDLYKERSDAAAGARTFRLVPAQATSFACNMNLANMDFWEYAESADSDGIFRGFHS
jgi:hypothetical protein